MTESIYKGYSPEEMQELMSNFLISSWSFSKIAQFARNAKAFEMQYVFGVHSRRSSTSIAGEAYHTALEYFFNSHPLKRGVEDPKVLDIIELEASAFQYIDEVPANTWKLQKTTPTVEEAKKDASDCAVKLLRNFVKEIGIYLDEVEEILDVELRHEAFLTINGVDIPLPCHCKIDIRVRLKNKRIVIMDHKSKKSYSPDDEVALVIGRQAITYVKMAEDATGEPVDEVWFMENKHSQNKSGAPQIQAFKVSIDQDTRSLYEALLYEPLKSMLEAVSNPEYVYLINDSDNFVDKSELYDHWCRTMICEVEDFNVEEAKKELVTKRLRKIRDSNISAVNPKVIKNFKENASSFIQYNLSTKNMTVNERIEHALRSFGAPAQVAHTLSGYSSDTLLLEISAGVKVSSIYSHRMDIANAMNVEDVRLSSKMVIYQDRSYLAVEVAKKREKDLLWNADDLNGYNIPVGKNNFGEIVFWDLKSHSTPHVLVCGQTGSGKSVFLKSTISYAFLIPGVKVTILDSKFDKDLLKFRSQGAEVYNEIEEIEAKMVMLVDYMNHLVRKGLVEYMLIVFDEFADALGQSKTGTLEANLRALAQKGRSAGIRLLAGTQRASTKVITGDAKANFPVQVCFKVPKKVDSVVVLDEAGAESLAGAGDGLIKSPEYRDTVRFQAYYKS